MICGLGYQIFHPSLPEWVGIVAYVFVGACILQVLGVLLKSANARGEDVAIALKRDSLVKQNFDIFWNTGEYKRLKAARRIR